MPIADTILSLRCNCGNRLLLNLVGMVLADPVLDVFADLRSQFSREISLTLRHKPIVVGGARISLSAQGVEPGDELSLRIDRKLQSLDRAVVFASAADNPVPSRALGGCRGSSDRVPGQAQLRIGGHFARDRLSIVFEMPIRICEQTLDLISS
jgi:hypothetical protein